MTDVCYNSRNITLLKIHQDRDCNHVYTVTPTSKSRIDRFGNQIPENQLKFEHSERQIKVPSGVYADFRSILKPIDTCEANSSTSDTKRTSVREPDSFAYLIKSPFDDTITKFVEYIGGRVAEEFVSKLETDLRELYFKYQKNTVPMKHLSLEEEFEFENADYFYMCEKNISK